MYEARRLKEPTNSSLDQYLREIGNIDLLTREQEQELARRIKAGDEDALEHLATANLRFVVKVAKRYSNQGLPLSDLICEGNVGLLKAAERFDETRGFKFISYAVWWIRQAILQALAEQSRIVRIPLNRVGVLYRLGKASAALEQTLGRKPTHAELSEKTGVREAEVALTLRIANGHVSLDGGTFPNDDGGLLESLVDENQADVDEALVEESLCQEMHSAISILTEREARIIRLYFGIGVDTTKTLEEIGQEFGLTRERIRQIKVEALNKLRKHASVRELDAYLEG